MIEGSGLSWSYGATPVLDRVDVTAADGRVLGLIGPNGSGKTTLLRLLHGSLRSPTGGVRVDGTDLAELAPRALSRLLAVVVQEEGGSDSVLTAGEMVLLGRAPHLPPLARTRPEDHRVAADALTRVGALHLAPRPFHALSGGERQRVLIARGLAQQAGHLLLDEPTNHLDIRYQHEVLALLRHVGGCCVVVLHDLNLAARYCDDLLLLDHDGRVVAAGSTDEVLDPALLEPVYGLPIRRLEVDGEIHLLFRPNSKESAPTSSAPAARPGHEVRTQYLVTARG